MAWNPLKAKSSPHLSSSCDGFKRCSVTSLLTVSRRLSDPGSALPHLPSIDEVLEVLPAEYVLPTSCAAGVDRALGLSHLQFEATLAAGRDPDNPNDFALRLAMLGLLA